MPRFLSLLVGRPIESLQDAATLATLDSQPAAMTAATAASLAVARVLRLFRIHKLYRFVRAADTCRFGGGGAWGRAPLCG